MAFEFVLSSCLKNVAHEKLHSCLDDKQREASAANVSVNSTVDGHTMGSKRSDGYGKSLQSSQRKFTYALKRIVGKGSFGTVFLAQCVETGDVVAIKKVLCDNLFTSREVEILSQLNHPNVVKLKDYYLSGQANTHIYRNLVMEYVPCNLREVSKQYARMPLMYVKLYTYQIFRSLAYLHNGFGVVHRDIKPENCLVDPVTNQLKLCDFGSAKVLKEGEKTDPYICSRPYRAPELILSSCQYTAAVDIWSVGCIIGELLLGRPLFLGRSESDDPMMDIMIVLGSPSREEVKCMNPANNFPFAPIRGLPWHKIFKKQREPQAIDLLARLLQYSPSIRSTAMEACLHPFFDQLRDPDCRLPCGGALPPIFDFTPEELKGITPDALQRLLPEPAQIQGKEPAPLIQEAQTAPPMPEESPKNHYLNSTLSPSSRFLQLSVNP